MKTTFAPALLAATVLAFSFTSESRAATFTIPPPVTTHPRLWITTNDLPRLRAWATPANPVYQALVPVLTATMNNCDTQYFPGGVRNPTWPDLGDSQGYTGLISEEEAFILALFSLIHSNATQRAVYAQRAADLIRVAMTQAAQGTLAGAPFRDPTFASYNRANATLETLPLAVDWIYNAVGTNGQPKSPSRPAHGCSRNTRFSARARRWRRIMVCRATARTSAALPEACRRRACFTAIATATCLAACWRSIPLDSTRPTSRDRNANSSARRCGTVFATPG